MTRAMTRDDDLDGLVAEATAHLRRSRQRFFVGVATVGVLVVAAFAGTYLMRDRVCTLTAPQDETLRIEIEGRTVVVPPGRSFDISLRPGSYAVTASGVRSPRSSIAVSALASRRVFAPVSDDQCFITANVMGMYGGEGDKGKAPTVYRITKPGQSASAGTLASDDVVVGDICHIPPARRLMANVEVVQPVRCSEVPATTTDASNLLLARYARCRLGRDD